jgi:hypothetical protein
VSEFQFCSAFQKGFQIYLVSDWECPSVNHSGSVSYSAFQKEFQIYYLFESVFHSVFVSLKGWLRNFPFGLV